MGNLTKVARGPFAHSKLFQMNGGKTRNPPDADLRSSYNAKAGTLLVQKRERRTAREWHGKISRMRSSQMSLINVSLKGR